MSAGLTPVALVAANDRDQAIGEALRKRAGELEKEHGDAAAVTAAMMTLAVAATTRLFGRGATAQQLRKIADVLESGRNCVGH